MKKKKKNKGNTLLLLQQQKQRENRANRQHNKQINKTFAREIHKIHKTHVEIEARYPLSIVYKVHTICACAHSFTYV